MIRGADSIKSPSPDKVAHNISTPTQVKYSIELQKEIQKSGQKH